VSDLPFNLPPGPAVTLAAAVDRERKIDRALEALGPIAGRDAVFLGAGPDETARWTAAGARLRSVDSLLGNDAVAIPDASFDAIATTWSGFRGVDPAELAEADRILRPNGRILVVHDYGRDDVSRLRGDRPEYAAWSRRDGPFLSQGFRVRVIHCFWTFDTLDAIRAFLGEAFGTHGESFGKALKRPRLTYNVAVYHRTRGARATDAEPAQATDAEPAQAATA
jgi:SAM-dependent methyltransferase